jgi:hypothetical protein
MGGGFVLMVMFGGVLTVWCDGNMILTSAL